MVLLRTSQLFSEDKMSRHFNGGKISGSHTTLIETAEPVVNTAIKLKEVSKICLSVITVSKSKKRLKFKPILSGWEVIVYGPKALQTLYIYTSDAEKTKLAIEKVFK